MKLLKPFLGGTKTHPPLPRIFGFFSPFSIPKFFPPTYLVPTYLPFPTSLLPTSSLPTSPLLPISLHFAFIPLLELGSSWNESYNNAPECLKRDPSRSLKQDPSGSLKVSSLSLPCFLFCFNKKGNDNEVAIVFFFFLLIWFCCNEEGDGTKL